MSPTKPVPKRTIVLGSGLATELFRVLFPGAEKLEMIVVADPKMESTE